MRLAFALIALVGTSLLAGTPQGAPLGQGSAPPADSPPGAQQGPAAQGGGASTAGVFAPVKDKKARPITAGGFVDGAPVLFDDRTRGSGLEAFRHASGTPEKTIILESPSGGVALVDIDNDGWLDVYLLNGAPPAKARLFRNNRDLTFTDITARAGVANDRWAFGVAAGDVDNDGQVDLYVTNAGQNRLYRNNGNGTFTDVAEAMGVTGGGWSTGASFGDYDRDGRLDLFVAGYVDIDPQPAPSSSTRADGRVSCTYRGEPVMCGPRGLAGAPDRLYHNEGGRFVDVTAKAGVTDTAGYYGFAAAWVDVDDDGDVDLLVVNDSTPNYLYRNEGDGTFEEVGFPSGFALNEEGRDQAGMGLAIGDYDNDGDVDTYITNFSDDSNTLRRNDGRGTFVDVTSAAGLRTPTLPFLGWGTGFLDVENDGWLDLFVANGHVYPQVDRFDWGMTWAQRPLLFRNRGGSGGGTRFEEVPAAPGSGLAVVVPARGAAFGDLDGDGRVDIVMNNHDRGPTLLRNVAPAAGHWVAFRLVGSARGPRDAIGAVVTVEAGGQRWRRDVISGGSYCSQSDLRVHVGLGRATRLDAVTVRWPGGRRERFSVPAIDRVVTLVEGRGREGEGSVGQTPHPPAPSPLGLQGRGGENAAEGGATLHRRAGDEATEEGAARHGRAGAGGSAAATGTTAALRARVGADVADAEAAIRGSERMPAGALRVRRTRVSADALVAPRTKVSAGALVVPRRRVSAGAWGTGREQGGDGARGAQAEMPAAAVAHVREAVAAQQREAWEEAARAYRRAIEVAPELAEAHANLGVVLVKLGRVDEAIAAYERALGLAPDLQAARINLGLAQFRAGAIGRALDLFDAAVERDPSSTQARALLGLALVEAGRGAEAIPHLEAASAVTPDDPALLFALGRAYAADAANSADSADSANSPDSADSRASSASPGSPASPAPPGSPSPGAPTSPAVPGAAASSGSVSADGRGASDRAAEVAARLSALPAGRPLWQHLQGLLLQRRGKHREALAAFDAARDAQPQLPGLALAAGVSLIAVGDDARAREAFEQARAQAPRDAVPLFYLAWTDERAGQAAAARQHAEQALARDPDLVEARTLLGRVLMGQGAFSEAARHLALATARDADDASIRYLLAQAYQRAGDTAAARREFEEARRLKAREIAHERRP